MSEEKNLIGLLVHDIRAKCTQIDTAYGDFSKSGINALLTDMMDNYAYQKSHDPEKQTKARNDFIKSIVYTLNNLDKNREFKDEYLVEYKVR